MKKYQRPVTKWEILFAAIVCISGIIGGYVGYSYPEHPILGKNRGVFIFLIVTGLVLVILEKWFGISKKIESEIAKKLKDSERLKNEKDEAQK